MVTLVCENENKGICARPLMLPLQQADICTATQKIYINEWLQLPWQFIGLCFFTRRRRTG